MKQALLFCIVSLFYISMLGQAPQEIRIIFSEITEDSFKWRVETPDENGNWTYNQYLMAKRIL
ncbi:MAG: hypothetical protein AAF242_16920 [Bacteroidota bacterium]